MSVRSRKSQRGPDTQPAQPPVRWHAKSAPEVTELLGTSPEVGLSATTAAERLKEHGYNELPTQKGPSLFTMIIDQFKDTLVLLLVGAALISAVLGEWVDAAVIASILVLNAIIGVTQEVRAGNALDALRKLAAPMATVIRDGETMRIASRELVPGDLVVIQTGDFVPADVRLVDSYNLKIEEAALTGESVPVEKEADAIFDDQVSVGDRLNSAFAGTVCTYGRGHGIVVSTGPHTQLGMIAGMLQTIEAEPTPLEKALESLGKVLGVAILGICALVFAIGMLRGGNLLEMFMTAVSLAVAAIPEGLAAVVTIVLALGTQRMVQRHVIIRHLPAVETLGATTVICSDKTGTLTQNQMTVTNLWAAGMDYRVTGEGYRPSGEFLRGTATLNDPADDPLLTLMLRVGLLCNDAELHSSGESAGRATWRIVGDPTEGSLVVAAGKAGMDRHEVERVYPRVEEVPFDSGRKLMSTLHRQPDGRILVCVKGAPDVLLGRCTQIMNGDGATLLGKAQRDEVLDANHAFAQQALRVLGMAYAELDAVPETVDSATVERDLTFVGLSAMFDPVRPEAVRAIEQCRKAGIIPVMITGDYQDTALAVGRSLNLVDDRSDVISGDELLQMSQAELVERAKTTSIYARVSPEHKVKIVDALKEGSGHIVAMTGDGVNDAMALKRADIGVAMGITGTDVAKETADMILTDDNFASIVSAVEEGRRVFANIRKFVFFLLSCNVGEVLIVFVSMLMGLPLPLRAIHLLWLNLVTDSLPALALGLEPAEPDIMSQKPRDPREPIINRLMITNIVIQAIVEAAATLASVVWAWNATGNLMYTQTVAFTTLVAAELLRAFTARSETHTVFKLGFGTNKAAVGASAISFALLLALIYVPGLEVIADTVPLSLADWSVIAPLAFLPAIVAELTKVFTRRR